MPIKQPREHKVVSLGEGPTPEELRPCENPAQASPLKRIGVQPHIRTLKIEAEGDPWRGLIKPKIRLIGRWLERAGFTPGHRAQVTCIAPGVIELRSADAVAVKESKPLSSDHPDCPS